MNQKGILVDIVMHYWWWKSHNVKEFSEVVPYFLHRRYRLQLNITAINLADITYEFSEHLISKQKEVQGQITWPDEW